MSGSRPYQMGGGGTVNCVPMEPICTSTPGPSLFLGMTWTWYWVAPPGLAQARVGPKEVTVAASAGAERGGGAGGGGGGGGWCVVGGVCGGGGGPSGSCEDHERDEPSKPEAHRS